MSNGSNTEIKTVLEMLQWQIDHGQTKNRNRLKFYRQILATFRSREASRLTIAIDMVGSHPDCFLSWPATSVCGYQILSIIDAITRLSDELEVTAYRHFTAGLYETTVIAYV
jgi:hypothetical protein